MGWQDAPEVSASPAWASAPEVQASKPKGVDVGSTVRALARLTPTGLLSSAMSEEGRQELANAVAGGLRGAGSIGATLLYPVDKATDIIKGDRGPNVTGLVTGKQPLSRNEERRRDMDEGLRMMGADPDSGAYRTAKLATEIGGTAGTGGLLANALTRAGVAGVAPNLVQAVRTAGMSAGSATGVANPLLRVAGGAINGGVSAGLVDPRQAATGAATGAILPAALQAAGAAGKAIGGAMRGPEQAPEVAQAVQAARDAGYVIPPTQARASLGNRLLEGFSGKLTTAQNASAKNQAVTNAKAATAIGLPENATITPEVLDAVRSEAGQAYKAVSQLGAFDATGAKMPASVNVSRTPANTLMGRPETATVDSGEVVRAWRQANADATAFYRQYARDANPETLTKAKAAASEAQQLDDFLVKQVEQTQKAAPGRLIADLAAGRIDQQTFLKRSLELGQQGDLAQNLKDAKVRIAKTYSVEDALNPATGTIDAKKLAKQLQKGKPLSGELKDIAEFSGRFPKASQAVESMGSLPQTSPIDWGAAAGLSAVTSNPLMLATAMARPAARAAALSPMVQNRLVQQPAGNALQRLSNADLDQILYRAAPAIAADR